MAVLTVTTIGTTLLTPAPQSVSASDTIAITGADVIVEVYGGAGSNNMTVVDGGRSPAGNLGTGQVYTIAVSPATRRFKIPASAQDTATGIVTVTNSAPTGVTVNLWRL